MRKKYTYNLAKFWLYRGTIKEGELLNATPDKRYVNLMDLKMAMKFGK